MLTIRGKSQFSFEYDQGRKKTVDYNIPYLTVSVQHDIEDEKERKKTEGENPDVR